MSVVVRHQPVGLTREKYDEVSRSLGGEGPWPPDGLDTHIMFGTEGELRVSEIWDSEDQFRSFFGRLEKALDDAGVEHGEPEVFEVHELQKREGAAT